MWEKYGDTTFPSINRILKQKKITNKILGGKTQMMDQTKVIMMGQLLTSTFLKSQPSENF